MRRFKRLTLGVFARIDEMIAQIENHDATVNSMIQEMRRAAATAKVQLKKVQQDGRTIQTKLRENQEAVMIWRQRAAACAETEETKALECLRRAKASKRRAESLAERAVEHTRTEQRLEQEVRQILQRLGELNEKQHLLKTRESRARALQCLNSDTATAEELQGVFNRWETRVEEMEITSGCEDPNDHFEEQFTSREEEQELKEELLTLRRETDEEAGGTS